MPPKKKSAPTNPLNERETRVIVAALKAMAVRPQINFEAMAKDLGFTNKNSAKNALFKVMKDKLDNDPVKLPLMAPDHKSSPLKRGHEQVEDNPLDGVRVKEPPIKRLNAMTLHKSIFEQDSEQEEGGGVSLDRPDSDNIPVPSVEPTEVIIPRAGLEHIAWPGMPNIYPPKHTKPLSIFDDEEEDEDLHLFKGKKLKLNGPRLHDQNHFNDAQEEFTTLRGQDHGGDDTDDKGTNSSHSSEEDGSEEDYSEEEESEED